jgi:hypothetical protein
MRDIVRKHSNALCSVKQELEHGKVVEWVQWRCNAEESWWSVPNRHSSYIGYERHQVVLHGIVEVQEVRFHWSGSLNILILYNY